MKTNVLIHEGVALKMDWVEPPRNWGEADMQEKEEYEYNRQVSKQKAIKERIEYEDQEMVIDAITKQVFFMEKFKDGIYVVYLPETVEQLRDDAKPVEIGELTGVNNRPNFNESNKFRMSQWTHDDRKKAISYLQSLET